MMKKREETQEKITSHATKATEIASIESEEVTNALNVLDENTRNIVSRILATLDPAINENLSFDMDANAGKLFAETNNSRLHFVGLGGKKHEWRFFDGKVWRKDSADTNVNHMANELISELSSVLRKTEDNGIKATVEEFLETYGNSRGRKKIIHESRGLLEKEEKAFNNQKEKFNCLNGTYDLGSFEFSENHSSSDYSTMISNVEYNPNAKCERFLKFIDEITNGDKELAKFLQKTCGLCLSGKILTESFFIWYGPTSRNGKGTLNHVLVQLLGDYVTSSDFSTFRKKAYQDGSKPSDDVARFKGIRYVSVSEIPIGSTLDSKLIKNITGRDVLSARHLYSHTTNFVSEAVVIFNTNDLPTVEDEAIFNSDRVYVIPFNQHFDINEQDGELKDKLTTSESLSGVLNWLIEGYRLLKTEELNPPESVKKATEDYRNWSDDVGRFLEDILVENEAGRISGQELHSEYVRWCKTVKSEPKSVKGFYTTLRTKGVRIQHDSKVNSVVCGYSFKNQQRDEI